MTLAVPPSWQPLFAAERAKPYFAELERFVDAAYASDTVYPPADRIFSAFSRTPRDRVRAVILGQDPYHEPGQAQGLAFYVPPDVRTPPSLANIAKELQREYPERTSGIPDLEAWAARGVLLLNATLTVAAKRAGSHKGKGWEIFTDAVVRHLSDTCEHVVFFLWGAPAQAKGAVIDRTRHLVLEAPHPSPLSAWRGFFGCNHFRQANDYLVAHGHEPVFA